MAGNSALRGLCAVLVALGLLTALCAADAVSDLQTKGRAAVDAEIAKSTTCTKDKLQVRREWYVHSAEDLCSTLIRDEGATSLPQRRRPTLPRSCVRPCPGAELKSMAEHLPGTTKAPSKLSSTTYPGAKTRYDDFVAIHIKNTMSIHNTVSAPTHLARIQDLNPRRATSSPGTDTSHSPTSKPSETNAATTEPNP